MAAARHLLLLGHATVAGNGSGLARQTGHVGVGLVAGNLTMVLGQRVTDGGHVEVLFREALGAMRSPADIGSVVYLRSNGQFGESSQAVL